MNPKSILTIVYIIAIALLFLRVDFWWWGTKVQPVLAGWITVPMLYQLGIWAVGVVLVFTVCLVVWKDEPAERNGQ
jgi:hypothetical protein